MLALARWRYCPLCTGGMVVDGTAKRCRDCGFTAYAASVPAVAAVCYRGDSILLARRARPPRRAAWDLVGGFLEEGEDPVDGLRREILEEVGLEPVSLEFLGVWVDRYDDVIVRATLNLVWAAAVAGKPCPADDIDEIAWFRPDQLPEPDELAFGVVSAALAVWSRRSASIAGDDEAVKPERNGHGDRRP